MKNSPIIVTEQSGIREDLNSDDPLGSSNVMSDEFIVEELFLFTWSRYQSHRMILQFYRAVKIEIYLSLMLLRFAPRTMLRIVFVAVDQEQNNAQ